MRTKTTLKGKNNYWKLKSMRVEESTQKEKVSPGQWCFTRNQPSTSFLSQAAPF